VILATGFRSSYPFLPQYYDGATREPPAGSATTVSPFLPLDGSHIRDLYLDQFYLRDPTLVFIGCALSVLCFVPHLSHSELQSCRRSRLWITRRSLWPRSGQIRQNSQAVRLCGCCTRRPWRNVEDTARTPCSWVQLSCRASYSFFVLSCNLPSSRVIARLAYLIGWLNEAAVEYGGKQVRYFRSRRDHDTDDARPG